MAEFRRSDGQQQPVHCILYRHSHLLATLSLHDCYAVPLVCVYLCRQLSNARGEVAHFAFKLVRIVAIVEISHTHTNTYNAFTCRRNFSSRKSLPRFGNSCFSWYDRTKQNTRREAINSKCVWKGFGRRKSNIYLTGARESYTARKRFDKRVAILNGRIFPPQES